MAEPGYAYEVQFKETLDAQDWHTLTNDVTAQETTTTQTATDSTTNARNTSTGSRARRRNKLGPAEAT